MNSMNFNHITPQAPAFKSRVIMNTQTADALNNISNKYGDEFKTNLLNQLEDLENNENDDIVELSYNAVNDQSSMYSITHNILGLRTIQNVDGDTYISEPVYKELVEVTHGDIDMSNMSMADKFAYFMKNKKTVPTNIIDMYDTAKSSPHSKNPINAFLKYVHIFNS